MPRIDIQIPDKIAWLLSKPKRIKIAEGGRGSGKSIGISDIVLMCADQGERICATREFQNTVDDSVHETLKQEIERLGVEGMNVSSTRIRTHNGGEIFYKGLARNITSLQSLGAVDKLWIEEGQSVSERSLKILTPSVRALADSGKMPEIWVSMNRFSRGDAVAKKYLARAEADLARTGYYEDDLCMIVRINYTDNPWFPQELELERLDDLENLPPDEYAHIWGGEYLESVERAIIRREWFDAAIDAHKKLGITPRGATVATHDPADGGDSYGYACRTGILYTDIDELTAGDGNEACDEATSRAIRANADLFVWDGDGIGALLRRQIGEAFSGKKTDLRMYKGSNGVDNPASRYEGLSQMGEKDRPKSNREVFKNKRAQFYFRLANRFYRTWLAVERGSYQDPDDLISIDSTIPLIDKVRSEVCRIPTIPNGMGLIQLMDKPRMKKLYDMDSPGMADCLAMGEEMPEGVSSDIEIPIPKNRGWLSA